MTPLHDKELEGLLKNLEGQLRMKPVHSEELRNRILIENEMDLAQPKRKPRRTKTWLAVAVSLLVLLGGSPFYSPAMASFVARILPLEITPPGSAETDGLHAAILQVVADKGYPISSVGTTPDPFTIHLAFIENDTSLSELEQAVEPAIRQLLYEQGIDHYQLDMTVVEEPEYEPSEASLLMDKIGEVLSKVYMDYGYTDLAEHATYGIKDGLFSNTLEVDMPDHVKEAKEIKAVLLDAIEKNQWDIQKVELRSYNAAHRGQEDRWATISSEIHDALAGKSAYSTTGLSYKVKDGVTHVQIKTALPEQPEPQLLMEVESAIQAYLEMNEIKSIIQKDHYRIQLLSAEKTVLLEVTNVSK